MLIREVMDSDYSPLISVLNDWWGGRNMSDQLPRLFFKHFKHTCFIGEENGEILGFLIGFVSQTYSDQAYIHFAGIHPEHRKKGIGQTLYNKFYDTVRAKGVKKVSGLTSPVNKLSLAFHTSIGFKIVEGDKIVDGFSVHSNYDGPSVGDRVLFEIEI